LSKILLILAETYQDCSDGLFTVDLTDRRNQVEQVVVSRLEDRINLLATLPTRQRRSICLETHRKGTWVTPAGAEIAKLRCRKDVFGFNPLSAGLIG
jgi:hypothetical protein